MRWTPRLFELEAICDDYTDNAEDLLGHMVIVATFKLNYIEH